MRKMSKKALDGRETDSECQFWCPRQARKPSRPERYAVLGGAVLGARSPAGA
jgi:hypothetical protein